VAGFWKKLLGDRGERVASRHLRRQGWKILARQYANRFGEIDLIALDCGTVVFVEVKTRASEQAGLPVEAVTLEKQKKLTRTALAFLKRRGWLERAARFDVVSILWAGDGSRPEITHYRNAFEPIGRGQMYS
jgi:putative endonuclease